MGQKSGAAKTPSEQIVRDIRRATRKHYSAEDKIRIVLDGLRGEYSIAELCRREGIAESLYYSWSKEFLEAGKRRLAGDTARAATTDEVKELRREAQELKEVVAEQALELRLLKKARLRMGETANEIPRLREARDHQVGRAVPSAGQAHAGETRHCPGDLLPLVRSLPIWRSRGAGRSPFTAKPGVEPHPRCDEGEDCQAGPGRADFVASGVVSTFYRQRKVLCLRGVGLSLPMI